LAAVRLAVIDLKMSTRLQEAVSRASARVGVNGGFFGVDGAPIGLAVSGGVALSDLAPDLSGGVLWVRDGIGHLTAAEEYREVTVDFAIQCRPRLVVDGKNNIRSDDGRRARRTVLCLRQEGRTLELAVAPDAPGPTLYELANELLRLGCRDALNLDGGPSTSWAWGDAKHGGAVVPLAPVRHAVVVIDR
jgi:uncharacterized protein YigE (DUF2233 family)